MLHEEVKGKTTCEAFRIQANCLSIALKYFKDKIEGEIFTKLTRKVYLDCIFKCKLAYLISEKAHIFINFN